ncbi:hypothetical protein SSX86_026687 [Deinandra increscens subsp. villosa]|uniref:DUF4408 domain-containing protein n=1 Tax=Deinandra increscens subsp. villosa TaxID=3103831 RepID=A0AAP0GMF4_9ASTR
MGVSMAIASITSWFTPTVLFCAANLIIATIFIASKTNHHQPADSSLSRVSSFLHRATSFNSSSSYSATITTETPRKYTSLSPLAQSIHSSSNDLSSSHGEELPAPSEPPLEIQPLSLFQRVNSSLKSSLRLT